MPRAARARDACLRHVSSVGGARRRGCAAAGAPEFFNGLPNAAAGRRRGAARSWTAPASPGRPGRRSRRTPATAARASASPNDAAAGSACARPVTSAESAARAFDATGESGLEAGLLMCAGRFTAWTAPMLRLKDMRDPSTRRQRFPHDWTIGLDTPQKNAKTPGMPGRSSVPLRGFERCVSWLYSVRFGSLPWDITAVGPPSTAGDRGSTVARLSRAPPYSGGRTSNGTRPISASPTRSTTW